MQNNSFLNQIKDFIKSNNVFTNLIVINVAVFALISILHVFFSLFLYTDGLIIFNEGTPNRQAFLKLTWNYLASTSDLEALIIRPWSIITYMFVHEDFMHILFNMLTFYFFGQYLFKFLGGRKLLSTYLLGGIAGWLLYALGYNFLPMLVQQGHGPMWGASAAVMATVVAGATYSPNTKINMLFAQIDFKYLAALFVIIDFLALDSGENAGGHLGHLGGAIYGFIMATYIKKGVDINKWFENILDRIANIGKKNPRMEVVYNRSKAANQSDEDYNFDKAKDQQKIDRILDKISKTGYDGLTKAEKAFLNKYSAK